MSTVDKLNKVLETKEAIKQALIDKGQDVGDVFAEYPNAIQSIEGGGRFVVPGGMKFAYSGVTEFPEDWDWSEVDNTEDGSYLFYKVQGKLPKINFKNVRDLTYTFGNTTVPTIDTSGWDTSNLSTLISTFNSSKIIEVPKMNTSNVYNFDNAFQYCRELKECKELDTSNATTIAALFYGCEKLRDLCEIDATNWRPSYISQYNGPVNDCKSLRNFGGLKNVSVDVYVGASKILSYESVLNIINGLADGVSGKTLYLAQDCVNLLSDDDIAIATNKGWSISPSKNIDGPLVVTDASQLPSIVEYVHPHLYDFSQYSNSWRRSTSNYNSIFSSTRLTVFEGDISSTTDASGMFYGCYYLKPEDIKITGTQNVKNISYMFTGEYINEFDFSNWNSGELNCDWVFGEYYKSYITLPTNLKLTGCAGLYFNNDRITSLDTRGWDVSDVTNMKCMFTGATNLEEIIGIEDWDVSKVTSMSEMFIGCKSLKRLDLSKWNTANLEDNALRFENCENLEEVKIQGLDFSNCWNLNSMFYGCKKLKHIDLTGVKFPLDSGTRANSMFCNCDSLESITMTEPFVFYDPTFDPTDLFSGTTTVGTFYYNPAYDYSKLIAKLPATWTAVPLTM